MLNPTLLTTICGTPNYNTDSNNDLHEKINMDKQPAPILTEMSIKDNDADPIDHNGNDPIKNFEKKTQISCHGYKCIVTHHKIM